MVEYFLALFHEISSSCLVPGYDPFSIPNTDTSTLLKLIMTDGTVNQFQFRDSAVLIFVTQI